MATTAELFNHFNLGNILFDRNQLPEAIACYRQALCLDPNHVGSHRKLASAFSRLGMLRESQQHNDEVLRIDPVDTTALYRRGTMRLLQGDLEGGWQDYEQRLAFPWAKPRAFEKPRWDGSPLQDKTILVYADHGLGDTLQFARYLPLLKQRGATVLLECQPALTKLLGGIEGIDLLIPAGSPLPSFDVFIPLLSLPCLFRTTLTSIPTTIPYLTVDPRRIEFWRQELERLKALNPEPTATVGFAVGSGLNIGIVWQGSMPYQGDCRSVPLQHFEPLARVQRVRLVSLQVGPGMQQLAAAYFPVIDLGRKFDLNSLEDLAAAMQNFDLVVTVDTAAAHLAGALGLPVWVALSQFPDWRWMLERTDSPWYPTMRLFRQNNMADWTSVFERIASEIHALLV
jgi:tetratricopeptide (TPR) repeat protein